MLLELAFPTRCPVCRRAGPAPCNGCAARLRRAPPVPAPVGLRSCEAFLSYEGAGRDLVSRLKYGNARDALGWVAEGMAGLADPAEVDVVTWAPTTPSRRRDRGFDQAELLARAVGAGLGRPVRGLLRRQPGPTQTGLGLAARADGPRFTSRAAATRRPGARVLLVDDVVTTGSTLSAAGRALASVGVTEVRAVAAARTPRPGSVNGPAP